MVTSQAVAVPKISTRALTPMSRTAVSDSARASTVRTRCDQTLSFEVSESTAMVTTGSTMMAATPVASRVHAGEAVLRRCQADARANSARRFCCRFVRGAASGARSVMAATLADQPRAFAGI